MLYCAAAQEAERGRDTARATLGMKEQLRLGAYVVLAFGVVLLLASLFADPLALGTPHTGFGWKQILGTLFGLGISVAGWLLVRRGEA
jgi:hypothetical protein